MDKNQLADNTSPNTPVTSSSTSPAITVGELRMEVIFGKSVDTYPELIKTKIAELINICEVVKKNGGDVRLAATAQTALEDASMWAVKAAISATGQDYHKKIEETQK